MSALEFVDLTSLKTNFGIGRSLCYELLKEGRISSVNVRREGRLRGKRLIEVESVRQFLASCSHQIDPLLSEQLAKTRRGENWRTNKSRRRRNGQSF